MTPGRTLALARGSLLLLVGSLPLMKISMPAFGYDVTLTDGLFLVTAALLGICLLRGETRLRWHPFFYLVAIYFAAMWLSLPSSSSPRDSLIKLATQTYLLSLPVLVFALVDSADELRRSLLTWLAASAIPAAIGAGTVLLFYAGIDRSLLHGVVHDFGLLPPGPYPRVEATFFFPAMLCNYLTISPFLLLAAFWRGWLSPTLCAALLALTVIAGIFTETAGLVGFGLALAACIYIARGGHSRTAAVAGAAAAVFLTLAISTVTPILHPTAPYLFHLPGGYQVAPSVRLMTWTAAWKVFVAHPVFGAGIGTVGLSVVFLDPSGIVHVLDDAHNSYLNIAAQCGLVGVAALILMIRYVAARTRFSSFSREGSISLLLGLAWLDAFAIQGFIGSFEDARHLWVLVGLWLASSRLDMAGQNATYGSAARSGATKLRRASTENNRSRE